MTVRQRLARTIRRRAKPMNGLSRTINWAFACLNFGQGIGICWGGPERWVSPGYSVVRQLPGAPYSWGIAISIFAALAIIGLIVRPVEHRFWWKAAGMFLIGAWCTAFAGAAAVTILTVEAAGTTGLFAYLIIAVTAALMIFTDERPPHASAP